MTEGVHVQIKQKLLQWIYVQVKLIFYSYLTLQFIIMDANRNYKSIQANLQFLKRFQGKTSIITKDGLISSLDSEPYSAVPASLKLHLRQPRQSHKQLIPIVNRHIIKQTNTEPSANVEPIDIHNEFLNLRIQTRQKKRSEQASKHSNRSERPTITEGKQDNYDLKLMRERLNRSDKLPKLSKSKSDRYMPYNGRIKYGRSVSQRDKIGSLPNYEIQLKNDINASTYFKQLQKFEANLRNLKSKTQKKISQMVVHY